MSKYIDQEDHMNERQDEQETDVIRNLEETSKKEMEGIVLLSDSIPVEVETFSELTDAIRNAPTTGEARVIKIINNFNFDGSISISDGRHIIIESGGGEVALSQTVNNWHFIIQNGSLTLKNQVTLTSHYHPETKASFRGGGVDVFGIFILDGGAISYNATDNFGGGVDVSDGGKFIMNSGSISHNYPHNFGSGVYVGTEGEFIMNGGTISHNQTDAHGGGVIVWQRGMFDMNGGEIHNNQARLSGGGVGVRGSGTFTMNEGTISGNAASNGGGVHVVGRFGMKDGTIIENAATANGGGVNISNSGTFTMEGGTIRLNEAPNGLGVRALGTFEMKDGNIIQNAAHTNGGGINVAANSTFIMTNGDIHENTATNGDGGGLYIASTNHMEILEGTVSSNEAPNRNGGGVFVATFDILEHLTVGSDVEFSSNEALDSFAPPFNARTVYPAIEATTSSIDGATHPLNNYDIGLPASEFSSFTLTVKSNTEMGDVILGGTSITNNRANIW